MITRNICGFHLLKAVNLWRQTGEGKLDIAFIRDKEKREVDFVILENGNPICLIECKYGETEISPSLKYFQEKLGVKIAIQLVGRKGISRKIKSKAGIIWIISTERLFGMLP